MFLLLYCKYGNFLFKVRSRQFSSVHLSIYIYIHCSITLLWAPSQNENMEIIFISFFSLQPVEEIDCLILKSTRTTRLVSRRSLIKPYIQACFYWTQGCDFNSGNLRQAVSFDMKAPRNEKFTTSFSSLFQCMLSTCVPSFWLNLQI